MFVLKEKVEDGADVLERGVLVDVFVVIDVDVFCLSACGVGLREDVLFLG